MCSMNCINTVFTVTVTGDISASVPVAHRVVEDMDLHENGLTG